MKFLLDLDDYERLQKYLKYVRPLQDPRRTMPYMIVTATFTWSFRHLSDLPCPSEICTNFPSPFDSTDVVFSIFLVNGKELLSQPFAYYQSHDYVVLLPGTTLAWGIQKMKISQTSPHAGGDE